MSFDWTTLPDIVWYSICEYLPKITDITHLSSTNHNLHNILKEDSFWRHLIRIRYGSVLLKRYCDEIFSNKNSCDNLCLSNKYLIEFGKQYSQLPPTILRNGWNLIVTGAQNGNIQGFAAAKRAKFYIPKLSSKLKMAIDEKIFRNLIPRHSKTILSKLIYYYLSKRIRLSFAFGSFVCFDITRITDIHHPNRISDATSDFSSVAVLDSKWLAAIRGEFHSIIPGRYAIICRMKLNLLRYEQPSDEDQFTGEFTCIPEFGVMSSYEWNQDWFDLHYVINNSANDNNEQNSQWFEETMGIITVYELSKVYFGLRIWQIPYRKYTVMCDYIELKIIE
ncbi:unnamed protein product [Rotaria sp. Silwood2]|nr:unnamed protein product [Rotaria sp. Silwood2]CAF2717593.1 unnamed protein product [Rotaria sp. Silwood2]CAF2973739.1 unnamed protein product [Rotaria sp. Silwood2]CAF3136556.1 unnamed protein product [Rotaria sp. Silwood2]CAF4095087.1 unnamed protein product [Rotaria sp. Silwood2]